MLWPRGIDPDARPALAAWSKMGMSATHVWMLAAVLVPLADAHAERLPAARLPRAALVVGAVPGPDAARLALLRTELGARYLLLEDPRTRASLESVVHLPSPAERLGRALVRARQRLRRFDLAGVHDELREARTAAAQMSPTAQARALAAELGVREAELAVVEHDDAAAARAMALAISAAPSLQLSPGWYAPSLLSLASRTRAAAAAAPRRRSMIRTTPPGVEVTLGGALRGVTPFTLDDSPNLPELVWLTRDGYLARAEVLEPGADLNVSLQPLGESDRLAQLVDAVRGSEGERRLAAALALASALAVDVVLVTASDGSMPTAYARVSAPPPSLARPPIVAEKAEPASPRPLPPSRKPWYRRGWIWGVAAGLIVAGTVAGTVGYFATTPETVRLQFGR